MNDNPYEPSQLEDSKPDRSWNQILATPALVALAIALAVLTGAIQWQASNRWVPLFFAAPVVAILIAATQFGSLAVWKSLKSIAIFVAVSVAGYVAFCTTCCGVNIASNGRLYEFSLATAEAVVITIVSTLFGCTVSFLLSRRYLKRRNSIER